MICGMDEAGRGPVIGPMVVAGVWMNAEEEHKLLEVKVRDSKKLIRRRRERLAEYIKKNFIHHFIVVEAEDIDNLRQIMSMNQLEAYIFAKLANMEKADVYYIDAASANEEAFKELIGKSIMHDCKIICEHGADDRYAIVSAASIVAKVERDERIKRIAKELEKKLDMPMGSGYPSDERTIEFIKAWIKKYGETPPHIRKSWNTVKRIENEIRQSKLF